MNCPIGTRKRSVYVAAVNRHHKGKTYVPHPLRLTYRDGDKVKQLTLGTLTDLPDDLIDLIRRRLNSKNPLDVGDRKLDVTRSLPPGHVAAVTSIPPSNRIAKRQDG